MCLQIELAKQVLEAQQSSSFIGKLFFAKLWLQFRRIRQRNGKSKVRRVLTLVGPVAFSRRIVLFQSSNQIGIQIRAKLTSVAGAGHVQRSCNRKNADVAVQTDAGLWGLRRRRGCNEAGQDGDAKES